MAQPSYQFPAPSQQDKLDAAESGAIVVTVLHIVQDSDGRYTFATSREDGVAGSELFVVPDVDGRDALNTSSVGAQSVAYFAALNAALL